jgi:Iron-sulfur cluster assembly accessory protein
LLSQRPENSRKGLRVEVAKGGCSGLHYEMTLGEREEGDSIVERDGVQFFIDDESVSYLRGATLDFTDGLTGTGFESSIQTRRVRADAVRRSKRRSQLKTGNRRALN